KYEAGSAFALLYDRGSVPDEQSLIRDLRRMLDLLDAVSATGLAWTANDEPIHLVFKWNPELQPRTIELHREVADRQGSVWWGRFSRSPQPSIASTRLEQLHQQAATGVATHAYLYRRGELWRATVEDVSASPPGADDPRFPSYYQPENCNLFAL